jgi:hypothetical protein
VDQLLAFLREHSWAGPLTLIAWAELRALPIARRQFAWLRAIGAKVQVTEKDVEAALKASTADVPSVDLSSIARRLGADEVKP